MWLLRWWKFDEIEGKLSSTEKRNSYVRKLYYQALDIKIGKLERLEDFDLTHEIVKEKLNERYGSNIPKDQIVISPASIYNSEKLINTFN